MRKIEIMTVLSVRENLTSQENQEHQFPVNYAYDYLNGGIAYLSLPPLTLNKLLQTKAFLQMADQRDRSGQCTQRSDNAIDLFPLTAGLPWATGILSCRQNKHWNISIETTRIFLQHLAADKSTQDLYKSGHSVAEISQKELDSTLEEGWVKCLHFLFSIRFLGDARHYLSNGELHSSVPFFGLIKQLMRRFQPCDMKDDVGDRYRRWSVRCLLLLGSRPKTKRIDLVELITGPDPRFILWKHGDLRDKWTISVDKVGLAIKRSRATVLWPSGSRGIYTLFPNQS